MIHVDETDKAQAELVLLENSLEQYQQGLSRLDRSRDLLVQNMEAIKRWQGSFSEPLEKFPGGIDLVGQTDSEARKAMSEFQELYDGARSEYLEAQKRIEAEIETKKRELASSRPAPESAKGGGSDVD